MDESRFPGYFFDYPDDEVAIQREFEIVDSLTSVPIQVSTVLNSGPYRRPLTKYVDPIFSPNSKSLYFDPLNPPLGAPPHESIRWCRISDQEINHCKNPIISAAYSHQPLFESTVSLPPNTVLPPLSNQNKAQANKLPYTSSYISPASSSCFFSGSLSNDSFLQAFSLLAARFPSFLSRLLVSHRYAAQGIYTFKFYKNGKWRYVHIDDYIPCLSASGNPIYSRGFFLSNLSEKIQTPQINPCDSEIFLMLLEKAYAKLHGCYESLNICALEESLRDLTPGAGISILPLGGAEEDSFYTKKDIKFINNNIEDNHIEESNIENRNVGLRSGGLAARFRRGILKKLKLNIFGNQNYTSIGEESNLLNMAEADLNNEDEENDPDETFCDDIWDILMKTVVEDNLLVGCVRYSEEPRNENILQTQGIHLGQVYQIVDLCITSSEPSEDFDALTLGMICIRNLRAGSVYSSAKNIHSITSNTIGRFNGRWSYGHSLWNDYKEIANDLKLRTREIQFERGLAPHPKDIDDHQEEVKMINLYKAQNKINTFTKLNGVSNSADRWGSWDDEGVNILEFEESDDPQLFNSASSNSVLSTIAAIKVPQPLSADLYWMQIEDFISIFTHIFIINDNSISEKFKCECKNFTSQWIPGDELVGSGGPPIVVDEEEVEEEVKVIEDGIEEIKLIKYLKKIPSLSRYFLQNPQYPFTVSEQTTVSITLYQQDKRWNINRVSEDLTSNSIYPYTGKNLSIYEYSLRSVMNYQHAIGFLIVEVGGQQYRIPNSNNIYTPFHLSNIVQGSDTLAYQASTSSFFILYPGRYVIIPYTETNLEEIFNYSLHIQFFSQHLEFDVDNLIQQRLSNRIDESNDIVIGGELVSHSSKKGSVSNTGGGRYRGPLPQNLNPNDLIKLYQEDDNDDASILFLDYEGSSSNSMKGGKSRIVSPMPSFPRFYRYPLYFFLPSTSGVDSNNHISNIYREVYELVKYVKSLQKEVNLLKGSIGTQNFNLNSPTHSQPSSPDRRRRN